MRHRDKTIFDMVSIRHIGFAVCCDVIVHPGTEFNVLSVS